jgi:hypothetical protein
MNVRSVYRSWIVAVLDSAFAGLILIDRAFPVWLDNRSFAEGGKVSDDLNIKGRGGPRCC